MFKERLKLTVKVLLSELILPILGFILIVIGGVWLFTRFPVLFIIAKVLILILLALILLLASGLFIHWLFIEPFQKKNRDNQE